MAIKAVLFDMDGVLAFTEQFYNRRRLAYLAERGVAADPAFDGSGSNDAAIWEKLVPGDAELRERLHAGYRAYSDEHPTPWAEVANPDVRQTFSELVGRGVLVAIASSSYRALIDEFIGELAIRDLVALSIAGEECRAYKPSPEIYLACMERLGVAPREVLVVEDSPIGIEAGKRSGAVVCALKPPAGVVLDQSAADMRIEWLYDVVGLISDVS